MQRGVSPLIGLVILVGLVVMLAVVSFSWGKGFLEQILPDSSGDELVCSNVKVKIISTCYKDQDATVYYTLENKGATEISKFLLIVDASELVQQEIDGLRSFGIASHSFAQQDFDPTTLHSIKVIPYIIGESEEMSCGGSSMTALRGIGGFHRPPSALV